MARPISAPCSLGESSDAVEKEMFRVIGAAKAGRGSHGAPLPRHRQHARESA